MGDEYPGYYLQNYCEDTAVFVIQQALQVSGLFGGAIDGKFGPVTQQAVNDFQASRGLSCDGIVGPITWDSLMTQSTGFIPKSTA